MRAVVCTELGSFEQLSVREIDPPAMGPGQVRIQVAAAGINFADTLLAAGQYQQKQTPPFVPGFEVAGTVIDASPGVTTCAVGDRVLARLDCGGFAEQAVAEASGVHVLPEAMDFVTAAGFSVVYGTSYYGLVNRAGLKAGETLVVHGAAGGVGLTAVEVGVALGCTVIATAGGPDKVKVALDHGATHGIDYKAEDIRERVKELTGGRGADVVYDPVGGDVFTASLRSIAPNGRILLIGFASGTVPQIPANHLLVKNVSTIGFWYGAYRKLDPAGMRACFDQLFDWWRQGKLKPHVSATYPLDQAVEALRQLKGRGSTGKLVLTV